MAVKSAWAGENASVIPRARSASPRASAPAGSTSNFGRLTSTRVGASERTMPSRRSPVSVVSTAGRPSAASGSTTSIDICPPL